MKASIRERLALMARRHPKRPPLPPGSFSPKAPLSIFSKIAGTMTIGRIAQMLQIPAYMARKEQIGFLRYVEDNAEFRPKWKHEIDAWLDYRMYQWDTIRPDSGNPANERLAQLPLSSDPSQNLM